MLDRGTVDQIAELAKIALTEAERERMREELSRILDYVAQVRAVPAEHEAGEPPAEPPGSWREDLVAPGMGRATLLALAPDEEAGHVRVPPVLD